MPDKPYEKIGDEYVFALKDEVSGATFTARAKIGPGAYSVDGDSLALFPERSSNHKRIIAYLESLPK